MAVDPTTLLWHMRDVGASDLHLKAGSKPGFRVESELRTLRDTPVMTHEDLAAFVQRMVPHELVDQLRESHGIDCSCDVPGLARFRVAVLQQREGLALVIRMIPEQVPTLEQLGLPRVCRELAEKPHGLVLVTGPTGSGKSTTLAAMLNHINATRRCHIVTLEDPIEFVHTDELAFVTQREIGAHAKSFERALREVLRQDPDVILVGEMRDKETVELALTAAETGHLVLATLHTSRAAGAVSRITDVFPSDGQRQVAVQLSNALQGVIAQRLLPAKGGGLVAAREILVATDAARALIRENRVEQLLTVMQTGTESGMQTLERGLANLVRIGKITEATALSTAERSAEIKEILSDRRAKAPGGGKRAKDTVKSR